MKYILEECPLLPSLHSASWYTFPIIITNGVYYYYSIRCTCTYYSMLIDPHAVTIWAVIMSIYGTYISVIEVHNNIINVTYVVFVTVVYEIKVMIRTVVHNGTIH